MLIKFNSFFDNLKIRTKITIAILPFIFLAWGITVWFSYVNITRNAIEVAGERLVLLGAESSSNISLQMEGYIHSLETLAISPSIVELVETSDATVLDESLIMNRDRAWFENDPALDPFIQSMINNPVSRNLLEFKSIYPEEVELIITDRRGINIAITGRTTDYLQSDEIWWQNAFAEGRGFVYVSNPNYDESIQKWVLIIALPIRSKESGNVVGILRGTIDITSLINSTSEITTGRSGYASLIGADGTIYYTRNKDLILHQAPAQFNSLIGSGQNQWHQNIPDLSGKSSVISLTPISGRYLGNTQLTLLISIEQDEIKAGIEMTFLFQLLGSLLMSLILGGICILIANNIGDALHRLELMTDQLPQSTLKPWSFEDVQVKPNLERKDEIGKLTRAFYQMAIKLQTSFSSLRESENRFRALSENILAGIFVVDDFCFRYANPAINHILGYAKDSLTGKDIRVFVHQEELKTMNEKMTTCLAEDNMTVHFESRWLRQDGEIIDVEISGTQLDFDGKPVFLGTLLDVTQNKRAAEEIRLFNVTLEQRVRERTLQLETANQELEAFSYSVSHDLNAPLRRIIGFSQIIQEDYGEALDENGRDYFNRIQSSALRMEQLIHDLLRLSRINRSEMNITQMDLCVQAQEIIQNLKSQDPHRKIEFILPQTLMVSADENLMRIALENLLGNAWKYSCTRALTQIVLGSMQLDSDEKIYFIRDNGVGFDMAYSDRLFEAFQRLHSDQDFVGNGIGLTLVKRIINRHKGRIWGESQVGQGATFYFTLGDG